MKLRESGMPEEPYWESLFNVKLILDRLEITARLRDVAEFGCGYGTFALSAARKIQGTLHGFDIEPAMIEECVRRAREAGIHNVQFHLRDFVDDGTGLAPDSVDYTMLFNILHAEQPLPLLREAWRILRPGGRVAVIHWNYDPTTPRGPSMEIRPRPDDCRRWMEEAAFIIEGGIIDLPPYHYGLLGRKERDNP